MKSKLLKYYVVTWTSRSGKLIHNKIIADLVLCFGSKQIFRANALYSNTTTQFTVPQITMCSTSGEIIDIHVQNNTLVAVALQFEKTKIETSTANVLDYKNSFEAAKSLIDNLPKLDLAYILVLADGTLVNGSELARCLNQSVDSKISITGGLAGDGTNFKSTLAGLNNSPKQGLIVATGFYGKGIFVTSGSECGWDKFGPEKNNYQIRGK